MISHFTKKIVTLALLCSFLVQLVAPAPVSAQLGPVPVSDAELRSKEVGLTVFGFTLKGVTYDSVMIAIVKRILERMSDSVVEWINNGFDGNPAFAVDPANFFLGVGDEIAGSYIQSIGAGQLCSPFKLQIQAAIRINYNSQRTGPRDPYGGRCTLSGTLGNIQDFFDGDFSQGGWEQFFNVTQNPNNNPYGAVIGAQAELSLRINNANLIESQKLSWAKGFLSSQDCLEYEQVPDPSYTGPQFASNGEPLTGVIPTVNGACKKPGPIKTPGTLIEGQLQNVLGSEIAQLELADEFDEIVSALVGQLVGTVFNQRGVINNSTVGWAAGGYGGGNNISPGQYGCYPDKQSGDTSASYTWTVAGTPPGATFSWSGTDGLGGTSASTTIRYAVGGIKSASVVVRETVVENGVSVQKSKTVACQPDIDVQKYPPITGFCYPINNLEYNPSLTLSEFRTKQVRRLRQSQGGRTPEPVAWVVFPSGGSGVYEDFVWDIKSINMPGFKDLTGDSEMVNGTVLHSVFPAGFYYDNTPNPRTASVRIYDAALADVEPVTIQCTSFDVI